MSHVEFTYTGASPLTLVAGGASPTSKSVTCLDWVGLYLAGPSRGSDFTAYGTDGVTARDRERDLLAVELLWHCGGDFQFTGGATTDEANRQCRINLRDLTVWFDSAPGRRFTVTLDDDAFGSWTADAVHEQWGTPLREGPNIQVRQQIVLPAGVMSAVA